MNLSQLQGEERQLLARLMDLEEMCMRQYLPRFTPFFNERQLLIAQETIRQRHLDNTMLYGGYSDAVRKVVGFFPPYTTPDTADFPFSTIDIRYRKEYELTHRDFLGSLMGMGLKRESVGDILIQPGLCTVFLLHPVDQLVVQELQKVGRVGVTCERASEQALAREQVFLEITGTVSSLRLDCLVSLLTHKSREKSAAMIQGELVQQNYTAATSGSRPFGEGETIAIRGYGKFIVDEIGRPTRKGRLPVRLRKYC